jgi:hypothetical protein
MKGNIFPMAETSCMKVGVVDNGIKMIHRKKEQEIIQ